MPRRHGQRKARGSVTHKLHGAYFVRHALLAAGPQGSSRYERRPSGHSNVKKHIKRVISQSFRNKRTKHQLPSFLEIAKQRLSGVITRLPKRMSAWSTQQLILDRAYRSIFRIAQPRTNEQCWNRTTGAASTARKISPCWHPSEDMKTGGEPCSPQLRRPVLALFACITTLHLAQLDILVELIETEQPNRRSFHW